MKCKELRASLFCNHLKIKGEKQLLQRSPLEYGFIKCALPRNLGIPEKKKRNPPYTDFTTKHCPSWNLNIPTPVPCEQVAFPHCFKHSPHTSAVGSLSALFFENYLPYASRPVFSIQAFTSSCLGGIKATVNRE